MDSWKIYTCGSDIEVRCCTLPLFSTVFHEGNLRVIFPPERWMMEKERVCVCECLQILNEHHHLSISINLNGAKMKEGRRKVVLCCIYG